MFLPILYIYNLLKSFRGDKANNSLIAKIIFGVLVAVLLLTVVLFFGWLFGSCRSKDKIDTDKIEQINQNNNTAKTEQLDKWLESVNKKRDEANNRVETANQQLANVSNKNYSNTNYNTSLKAMCETYPDAKECQ